MMGYRIYTHEEKGKHYDEMQILPNGWVKMSDTGLPCVYYPPNAIIRIEKVL